MISDRKIQVIANALECEVEAIEDSLHFLSEVRLPTGLFDMHLRVKPWFFGDSSGKLLVICSAVGNMCLGVSAIREGDHNDDPYRSGLVIIDKAKVISPVPQSLPRYPPPRYEKVVEAVKEAVVARYTRLGNDPWEKI